MMSERYSGKGKESIVVDGVPSHQRPLGQCFPQKVETNASLWS